MKRTRRLPEIGIVLASGILACSAAFAADRDSAIDQAMGASDQNSAVERSLTEAPQPWPGPRFEPPFKQQPEAAQQDFRAPVQAEAGRQNPIN